MQKTIVADNVSMCFNLASERVDSLKDLLIKKIKFQSLKICSCTISSIKNTLI